MAKAEKNVKRTVVVEETVTLALSIREAEFLGAVLAKVAGDETNSPRKHQRAISRALTAAGVHNGITFRAGEPHAHELSRGTIMYDNYPATWSENARG